MQTAWETLKEKLARRSNEVGRMAVEFEAYRDIYTAIMIRRPMVSETAQPHKRLRELSDDFFERWFSMNEVQKSELVEEYRGLVISALR